MNTRTKWIFGLVLAIILLNLISLVISLASTLNYLESLRIVFGSIYVLFLPGFVLTFIFFSLGKIDTIERVALSFALSIAIVPLFVFYLNLVGLKITALNTFFTILAIILISSIILYYKNKKSKYNLLGYEFKKR